MSTTAHSTPATEQKEPIMQVTNTLNGVDVARLLETIDHVSADDPPVLLGENRAPNPPEYVLHALAACMAGTIVYHAAARGIALDGLQCTIEGDLDLHGFLGLEESVRPGYQSIRAAFEVTGDFDDEQLAELAGLIRYSPVRDIVSNPVPVAIDLARA